MVTQDEELMHIEPIPEEARALLAGIPDTEEPAAAEEPPAPTIPTKDLIAPLVALVCSAAVPAWEITTAEQDTLAESYAAVVDKYFPAGISMGPEVGALLVTAAIIVPRLGTPARPESAPDTAADEQEGGGDAA